MRSALRISCLKGEMAEAILHPIAGRYPHLQLHLLVDLARSFSRRELETAAARVLQHHPVLACRYSPGLWRDRWVAWSGDIEELVRVERAEGDLDAATRRQVEQTFDHERDPLWRAALLTRGNGSRLIVSAHHMMADGGGIKAIANALAAHLSGGKPHPPAGADRGLMQAASRLRLRDLPVLAAELAREASQPLSILRVRRVFPGWTSTGGGSPRWRTIFLDAEAADRFRSFCRRNGATINDGLVAAVIQLAAARAGKGPAAAGYTIDLRRYLRHPASLVTNLHGVSLVVLSRKRLGTPVSAVRAVSRCIGAQKRRLLGLSYALLPSLCIGWLPHALLRKVGKPTIRRLLSFMGRVVPVTNIGPLDEALSPFGEDAIAASVLGPFVSGLHTPIVTASGFRGDLTLHVCGTSGGSAEDLNGFTRGLRAECHRERAAAEND